jgi:uncharacterized repeat protein (TIGR01451 family)
VSAGSQIGFTVTLNNSGAGTGTGLSVTDNLPAGTDVNWTVDAGKTDTGWSVSGSPPNQALVYSPTTLAGNTSTTAHVISSTTSNSCGTYNNTASFTTDNGGSGSASDSEKVVCPVQLTKVVSRATHGSVGTFDINLPLTGTRGVECRSGGATNDYAMVFSFAHNLTSVGGASVSSSGGTCTPQNGCMVSSTVIGPNASLKLAANQCQVNLTGVTNAQYITVTLTNVTDSVGNFSSAVAATMGVLMGDVDASGRVDGTDVSLIRQNNFQTLTQDPPTFLYDIDASGRIDGTDISLARQQNFTVLPSPP